MTIGGGGRTEEDEIEKQRIEMDRQGTEESAYAQDDELCGHVRSVKLGQKKTLFATFPLCSRFHSLA